MDILQPKVGDRVKVRQRTWVVQDVDSYDGCRILTLSGNGGGTALRTCRVIHPFDDVAAVDLSKRPTRVGIRAWRRACRALIASDGDASALRTAGSARIDLLPYQLEPALALLQGHGARLLIADEVGLGKTVQAMLVFAELLARGAASRVLVVCPAGLREQWAEECGSRFQLPLTVFDQPAVRRLRTSLPIGINPWTTEPLVTASIDFVKRPEVLPAVLAANWDVVVVDEAHGSCGESDRRDAVSRLCRRAPYVVLLTATPHNGDEEAFASLCRFGQHDDPLVVFRRSRLEAGRDAGRRAHTVKVAPSSAERRMHAALAALTRAVRRETTQMERHVWLMLALFHKRALSCPCALASSVERRLQMLGNDQPLGHEQLLLPLDDESGELDGSDAAPMWAVPALRDTRRERQLLEQLADTARRAQGDDSKLRRLHRLLTRLREPAIVFTEYRDTLLHVRAQVAPDAAIIHGGMTREQRHLALAAFPKCRVLLATDAAGEGLNLQHHCRVVINLELPWNPMRLEQRIGRVDRIGQRRRVHVFHLVSRGTGETRLLDRLSARVSQAQARVGAPDPMCGRPAWTEEASARLVVLRDDAPLVNPHGVATPPAVPVTRLHGEADREAARLRIIRLVAAPIRDVAKDQTTCSSSGPLIAHTRHSRSRLALGGRTLALFSTTIQDGSGRSVATRVDAALCSGHAAATAIRQIEALAPHAVWPGRSTWMDESCRLHERVTTLRLLRARAIAALFRNGHGEFQPGLFDRRAEHELADQSDERQSALADAEERIARLEASAPVSVSPAELRLVLFSGHPVSPP
ncbi:MAG: helicase-related protein [Vicinamibacterales bacterium]